MITPQVTSKIEDFIQSKIISNNSVGGGCIADSRVVLFESGAKCFLKCGHNGDMFPKEANGLLELAKANVIDVPQVILAEADFLLLEYIPSSTKSKYFFEEFGASLAKLHQYQNSKFGFYEDNYIGATPQINICDITLSNNWKSFYYHNRLLYQFRLAEQNGYASKEMRDAFTVLTSKIDQIFEGSEEPPTLLHGDLWGGNYITNDQGNAVLIDPAVYYGHREADLAMTKIFGGFTETFYESYAAVYPLKDGFEFREPIYRLYHILNHLNLFGYSYYNEAIELMRFYA